MTSPNSPNSRLFIGSLPYRFTEGELLALFIPFGRVIAVKIIHNRWGKSRGLGYVEFDNLESAITAKTQMHNYKMEDRSIIVDYAQPDPFNTPEGQQRHEEALARRPKPKIRPESNKPRYLDKKELTKTFPPKRYAKPGETLRQSVYDSRAHHSRTGAKFASRNKTKKV